VKLWQEIERDTGEDLEIKVTGGLMLGESDRDIDFLKGKIALEKSRGIEAELIGANELRALEPCIGDVAIAAEWCPGEGKINPLKGTYAVVAKAKALGARFRRGSNVLAIERDGTHWKVSTSRGEIRARRVVNTAGPWAAEVARLAGVEIPVRGAPLQMVVTEPTAPTLSRLVAYAHRHLTLKQMGSGAFMIGGGWTAALDESRSCRGRCGQRRGQSLDRGRAVPALRRSARHPHLGRHERQHRPRADPGRGAGPAGLLQLRQLQRLYPGAGAVAADRRAGRRQADQPAGRTLLDPAVRLRLHGQSWFHRATHYRWYFSPDRSVKFRRAGARFSGKSRSPAAAGWNPALAAEPIWAMDRAFYPLFLRDCAQPLPIIGGWRAVVQCGAHDDGRLALNGSPNGLNDSARLAACRCVFQRGRGSPGRVAGEACDADGIAIEGLPGRGAGVADGRAARRPLANVGGRRRMFGGYRILGPSDAHAICVFRESPGTRLRRLMPGERRGRPVGAVNAARYPACRGTARDPAVDRRSNGVFSARRVSPGTLEFGLPMPMASASKRSQAGGKRRESRESNQMAFFGGGGGPLDSWTLGRKC
jgi:glycine/D-amino acid oxidase-like deaminating enzyme